MGFLSDYVYYSSGNEAPEEYVLWGGLSILGHILGNKTWVYHGDYFRFSPNIYPVLVGDAGSGKNTALGVNIDIMIKHFPDQLVSASIQSREDIAHQMGTETTTNPKVWKDEKGMLQDYRPFYILNNELASFLSVDKLRMVEFLTEVYDGKQFSTGFKKDRIENPTRKQWFRNPHVSLIAGAVPEWFMSSLKLDLFSGGLGRRMIIVYANRTKTVDDPKKPAGADAAMSRVIEHLKEADKFSGGYYRTEKAMLWWKEWYHKHREDSPQDPILRQFHQTLAMQVLKIALLIATDSHPFNKEMTDEHLQIALAMIEKTFPNVVKLTSGIGRNELAGVAAQLLDFLERTGGMQTEKNVIKYFRRYAKTPEFMEICNSYIKTGELVLMQEPKSGELLYFTPTGHEQWKKWQEQKNEKNAKESGGQAEVK